MTFAANWAILRPMKTPVSLSYSELAAAGHKAAAKADAEARAAGLQVAGIDTPREDGKPGAKAAAKTASRKPSFGLARKL